jgi:FkbM family methyltransferase
MEKELNYLLSKPVSYYFNKFPVFDFKKNKEVILFGAARMGYLGIKHCQKNRIRVLAICDNDLSRAGTKIGNISVINIKTLLTFPKTTPIIITSIHDDEIHNQLKKLGFHRVWSQTYFSSFFTNKFYNPSWANPIDVLLSHKKDIIKAFHIYEDEESKKTFLGVLKNRLFIDKKYISEIKRDISKEYFDNDVIKLSKEEVFVDGGAFDGDTINAFIKKTKNKFKKIYAFEPDEITYKKLNQYVKSLKDNRIIIMRKGIGVKKTTVSFANDGSFGSRISKTGEIKIKIVSLDEMLKDKKPTFIKYDIEGAEIDALKGAINIIKRNKPKLAICVYHKPTDTWRIPFLLKKILPEYKLRLRHYGDLMYETVCYAQVD